MKLFASGRRSVADDLTATYGPDGQILTQDLPGGIRVTTTYDPSVSPLSRVYTRISDGQTLVFSVITENTKGKWASQARTAAASTYTYDAFGRFTDVQQATAATNVHLAALHLHRPCSAHLQGNQDDPWRVRSSDRRHGHP